MEHGLRILTLRFGCCGFSVDLYERAVVPVQHELSAHPERSGLAALVVRARVTRSCFGGGGERDPRPVLIGQVGTKQSKLELGVVRSFDVPFAHVHPLVGVF